MPKGLILIPARYQSQRFPGKPLAPISQKTMIQTIYENLRDCGSEVCVVTDHDLIEKHLQEIGAKVVRVDDDVPSGTERIHLAFERFFKNHGYEYIINVQGDEPLLKGQEIRELLDLHTKRGFDISTLVKRRQGDQEDFQNPNIVKAVYSDSTGECHYFSRSPVPHKRGGEVPDFWFQHIGVYLYNRSALEKFCKSPLSYYEEMEKLEQLRALELGMRIGAKETQAKLIGVDTPEDLKRVEGVLRGKE